MRAEQASIEAIFQSIFGLIRAATMTRGGVWTQNLMPAMEPVIARLSANELVQSIASDLRRRQARDPDFGRLLTSSMSRYLAALATYAESPVSEVAVSAATALRLGEELLSLLAMSLSTAAADDVRTIAGTVRVLGGHRPRTPAEGHVIMELRKKLADNPSDIATRDRLFELESK